MWCFINDLRINMIWFTEKDISIFIKLHCKQFLLEFHNNLIESLFPTGIMILQYI